MAMSRRAGGWSLLALAWLALTPLARAQAAHAEKASAATALEQKWGVVPVAVRLSAAGRLVDFRYRVLDAAKAASLFKSKVKPSLKDLAAGTVLDMPTDTKLGALRSSPRSQAIVGKQYFVLFSNPLQAVKRGARVEISLGDCVFTDLIVE